MFVLVGVQLVLSCLGGPLGCESDAPQRNTAAPPSDEPVLPRSTTVLPTADDSTTVTVGKRALSFDGRKLTEIPIDASQIRGGESGLTIITLLEELKSTVELTEQNGDDAAQDGGPTLSVAVDRSTPHRLLEKVLLTAGKAGVSDYRLGVRGREGESRRTIRFYLPNLHTCCPQSGDATPNVRTLGHLGHFLGESVAVGYNVPFSFLEALGTDGTNGGSIGRSPSPGSRAKYAARDVKSHDTGSDSGVEPRRNDDAVDSDVSRLGGEVDVEGESPRPCQAFTGSRSLGLTVVVEPNGFRIGSPNAILPPLPSCPKDGPTICLHEESTDVEQKIHDLRELLHEDIDEEGVRAADLLREIEDAYDWKSLHEKLVEIKRRFPKKTGIKIATPPDFPVLLAVRTMDVARFELSKETFESPAAFQRTLWDEPVPKTAQGNLWVPEVLFSDPVLVTTD